MVNVRCPNKFCGNVQSQVGFRPMSFYCENCGMVGLWHKYQNEGRIYWRGTVYAVYYVFDALMDRGLWLVMDDDQVFDLALEMVQEVEMSNQHAPHQ